MLLTATPVQLGTGDLFSLLNLLRPDLVIDRPTVERIADPNSEINGAIAAIRAVRPGGRTRRSIISAKPRRPIGAGSCWAPPRIRTLIAAISETHDDEGRVRLIHRIEALHSFASMISRTRRRDIGAFTTRKPRTEAVSFTPEQQAVHDAILDVQRTVYQRTHGSGPLGFLMTTIRRQAASLAAWARPVLGNDPHPSPVGDRTRRDRRRGGGCAGQRRRCDSGRNRCGVDTGPAAAGERSEVGSPAHHRS